MTALWFTLLRTFYSTKRAQQIPLFPPGDVKESWSLFGLITMVQIFR